MGAQIKCARAPHRLLCDNYDLQVLINKGYTHLTLQIGRGNYEPPTPLEVNGIQLEFYRFKPSLHDDMKRASLVISHGGNTLIP